MIQVENLSIAAGEFALQDISFHVAASEYCVLMGQTGSGKTTILECILGLREIAKGSIKLCGKDVTNLNPAVRGIGYVPQDEALFSTMSVREHLDFALMIRRVPEQKANGRVVELASLLGIEHLLERKPANLSGGERQRVALGRALSFSPKILCLDEPLSALDDETRDRMCDLLKTVQQQTGTTVLHVTHNREIAKRLGDTILRIEEGVVTSAEM